MKGKLTSFRYSDRSFEIEYKLRWYKGESSDKINVEQTIDNIMNLCLNFPYDKRKPFEKVALFKDANNKIRLFITTKDETLDAPLNVEGLTILIGASIVFK